MYFFVGKRILSLLYNERIILAHFGDESKKEQNCIYNYKKAAYMTKRDLKSLVLPLFTIVLGKNFSMTKNLLSLRLSSHH